MKVMRNFNQKFTKKLEISTENKGEDKFLCHDILSTLPNTNFPATELQPRNLGFHNSLLLNDL